MTLLQLHSRVKLMDNILNWKVSQFLVLSIGIEASSSNTSWASIKHQFVEMGYSSTMVDKAIGIHGTDNWNEILEYLLTCKAFDYSLDSSHEISTLDYERLVCDTKYDFEENQVKSEDFFVRFEDSKETRSKDFQADIIIASLLEMGYSENEVTSAIEINGIATPIDELVDFIDASLCGKEESNNDLESVILENHKNKNQKKQGKEACTRKFRKRKDEGGIFSGLLSGSSSVHKKAVREHQKKLFKNYKHIEKMRCKQALTELSFDVPDPRQEELIGFGVPGKPGGRRFKELKAFIQGPPFFYFENDAFAPKDIWKTISRHFNCVEPEFVDSKYFSASIRPRGYVHNLPIDGRFQALPLPPMTIQEALPQTKNYWPSWDQRKKLSCIGTGRVNDVLCQELKSILRNSQGRPSLSEQAYILEKCELWNLVWVGLDQISPLEPHEIEVILGYEKDHTRGASCQTDRLQCLGNSFQIDTVAYHLSVLKLFYPDGVKVLSLFSGIGGAEVALHRLGIHLMCVVSVEICPKNRVILNSWWKKTHQTGRFIEKEDVQHLTIEVLQDLVDMVGGFDLIIGGIPCNNICANSRTSGDGLGGSKPSFFYECPRIVNEVRKIMHSKGMA